MKKKGVSVIVGYVLLIMVVMSLSILVYSWVRSYIPKEIAECPEKLSLFIESYSCNTEEKIINIIIKNNGLFNVDGYLAKIANTSDSLAVYSLKDEDGFEEIFFADESKNREKLKPNQKQSKNFNYQEYDKIEKLEILPFVYKDKIILCENSVVSQSIKNC